MRHLTAILMLLAPSAWGAVTLPAADHNFDWNLWCGVSGGIPTGQTVFTNLPAGSTHTTINAWIAACPSNRVVQLDEGEYNLTGQITMSKDGVVLRGTGSPSPTTGTRLISSYDGSKIFIAGKGYVDPESLPANQVWSVLAAPPKNATNIHVATTNGFRPGQVVIMDQINDSIDVDNRSNEGYSAPNLSGVADHTYARDSGTRGYIQSLKILNVSQTNLHTEPPILGTNWNAGLSIEIWTWGLGLEDTIRRVGIENLYITNALASPNDYNLEFQYWEECWMSNVVTHMADFAHVWWDTGHRPHAEACWQQFTFNYASQSYGMKIERCGFGRFENNISYTLTTPWLFQASTMGHALLYNYTTNMRYDVAGWMQPGIYTHGLHVYGCIFEGNKTTAVIHDKIHGSSSHNITLRNRLYASEPTKVNHTYAYQAYSTNHWTYALGNCMGTVGVHTNYLLTVTNDFGDCPDASIFFYGQFNTFCTNHPLESIHAYNTATIEGNWNVVHDDYHYFDAEASDIPNSLYYDERPAYFGGLEWPPYGPGVTAQDGGYTNVIPAELRFNGIEVPEAGGGDPDPPATGPARMNGPRNVILLGPGFSGVAPSNSIEMPGPYSTIWASNSSAGWVPLFIVYDYRHSDFGWDLTAHLYPKFITLTQPIHTFVETYHP